MDLRRNWIFWGLAAFFGLAGGMLSERISGGPEALARTLEENPGETSSAREFLLVDSDGKTLAAFHSPSKGTAALSFFDENGAARASLSLLNGRYPEFQMMDQEGTRRFLIALDGDGNPFMALSDESGKSRIGVRLTPAEEPHIHLSKKETRGRIDLYVYDDGEAGINLRGDRENVKARLRIPSKENPTLSFFGENGERIWSSSGGDPIGKTENEE
ncbi:MAG TPA: hypothetical protein VIU33_09345 [Nitrospiria bacterium]